MHHFANRGHSAFTEAAQGFKGDGAKSVARIIAIPEILLELVLVQAPGGGTGLPGRAMHVAGSKRVDEGDIP
jgi:hypothetical protein